MTDIIDLKKEINCSVVASVYNEEESIMMFYESLSETLVSLQINYEIIFVNDGSIDNSLSILKEISVSDPTVKIIDFSKNFGHEAAMIAGIDHACGEAVICMDSDLQHPPAMIPEMLQKKAAGFEVVNMVRTLRKDAGLIQKMNSKLFYKFVNSISSVKLAENASDFFLISQKVCKLLRSNFRERTRFLRGIIQLVGFRKTTLEYIAPKRIAGKSKYSFFKLLKLSFTAISSFSKLPLQLGVITGLIFSAISIILIIYSLVMWILDKTIPGYTTLIIFMSAFAGIQLFVTGLIGQYISYVFDEVKERPVYIVNEVYGGEDIDISGTK
ncbi:MAG: glycosyltransferase family 2 protein [Bacteroidetes bacterium]|nr:glycosyltransferase family 2 protein [Bacteroidota bacterium]